MTTPPSRPSVKTVGFATPQESRERAFHAANDRRSAARRDALQAFRRSMMGPEGGQPGSGSSDALFPVRGSAAGAPPSNAEVHECIEVITRAIAVLRPNSAEEADQSTGPDATTIVLKAAMEILKASNWSLIPPAVEGKALAFLAALPALAGDFHVVIYMLALAVESTPESRMWTRWMPVVADVVERVPVHHQVAAACGAYAELAYELGKACRAPLEFVRSVVVSCWQSARGVQALVGVLETIPLVCRHASEVAVFELPGRLREIYSVLSAEQAHSVLACASTLVEMGAPATILADLLDQSASTLLAAISTPETCLKTWALATRGTSLQLPNRLSWPALLRAMASPEHGAWAVEIVDNVLSRPEPPTGLEPGMLLPAAQAATVGIQTPGPTRLFALRFLAALARHPILRTHLQSGLRQSGPATREAIRSLMRDAPPEARVWAQAVDACAR